MILLDWYKQCRYRLTGSSGCIQVNPEMQRAVLPQFLVRGFTFARMRPFVNFRIRPKGRTLINPGKNTKRKAVNGLAVVSFL